jgi:putative nucleotidyltransferase with HDIG domain
MKEIFVMVVTLAQKNLYRTSNEYYKSLMEKLWEHSLGTALASRWLSGKVNCRDKADSLFMGGLLHDIGKLVLLKVVEEVENGNEKGTVKVSESLMGEMFETMHTNVGATLLERQKLPEPLSRMAHDHHLEDDHTDESMDILKIANLVCHKIGIGLTHDPELLISGTTSAERLGLSDIDIAELEVSMESQLEDLNQRMA